MFERFYDGRFAVERLAKGIADKNAQKHEHRRPKADKADEKCTGAADAGKGQCMSLARKTLFKPPNSFGIEVVLVHCVSLS